MRRLLPLLTLTLVATAAAQMVAPATSYAPDRWPALERTVQQVPAFAGFTLGEEKGKGVVRLALTDLKKETALRAALNDDAYWSEHTRGWSIGAGAVKMKTPVSRLLEVARKVKSARPNAEVRIDTAFGRVRLNASAAYTQELAAKLKVDDLLVHNTWQPLPILKYDVQPRTVSLSQIPKNDPFHAVVGLKVLVKNIGNEVVQFNYTCGGNIPIGIVTARGEQTPQLGGIGCTQEARSRLIQPSETVTFHSFSWNDLQKLKPGKYAWVLQREPTFKSFAFRLTK